MANKKLPDELVAQLVEQGFTSPQIVDELRLRKGIRVTRQAVSVWKKRHGHVARSDVLGKGWAPWQVPPEHQNTEPYRILRLAEREAAGFELTPPQQRRLDAAKALLAQYSNEYGIGVFNYNPTRDGSPWEVKARRKWDGDKLYRKPPRGK